MNCINVKILVQSYASETCSDKHRLFATNRIDVIDHDISIAYTDNERIINERINVNSTIGIAINSHIKIFYRKRIDKLIIKSKKIKALNIIII